jgi:hypothetical protein
MKANNFLLFLVLALIIFSCRKDPKITTSYRYAFFVAGHTYGSPLFPPQFGLHQPFENHIPFINNYQKMNFGVLTGDVVNKPYQQYWDSAIYQINKLNMPIHISAGNHDRGETFDALYEPYYSYQLHGDLFIILNTNGWKIINDQKYFLEQTIKDYAHKVNNIFVFTHELIWWSPTNMFKNIKFNYLPNYPGSTNYWEDIFPLFDTLDNNITLFAGDIGATDKVTPYMYHKEKNITYIANGMGSYKNDNLITIEVDYKGIPHYKLFGLDSIQPYIIEDLESFKLP